MSNDVKAFVRLDELEMESFNEGTIYESSDGGIADALGLTKIGAAYTIVPPGKTACPFHVHHAEDEMFILLKGSGEYRFGAERHQVKAGDVLGAPVGGPEFAHQLFNTGDEPLVYIGISNKADTDVVQYPDTGKIMSMSRRQGHQQFGHRHMTFEDAKVGYFAGDPNVKE